MIGSLLTPVLSVTKSHCAAHNLTIHGKRPRFVGLSWKSMAFTHESRNALELRKKSFDSKFADANCDKEKASVGQEPQRFNLHNRLIVFFMSAIPSRAKSK